MQCQTCRLECAKGKCQVRNQLEADIQEFKQALSDAKDRLDDHNKHLDHEMELQLGKYVCDAGHEYVRSPAEEMRSAGMVPFL